MASPSDLASASKCYCFDNGTAKSVIVYLLASKAGLLSTTPSALASLAKCYCFDDGTFMRVVSYILASNSGLSSSTPTALASSAACYCFDDTTEKAVIIYSLASNAGLLSSTPSSLALSAACYCYDWSTFKGVVVYLLATIGSITATPTALSLLASCYCFLLGTWKSVVAYLLNASVTPPPPAFPLSNPTLLGWWKADSLSLANGTPVSAWNDSSNSGFTMTGAGATRPTFNTNVKNGLPAVLFNQANAQVLTSAMPANTKPFTAAGVIQSNDFSTHDGGWLSSSQNNDMQLGTFGTQPQFRRQSASIIGSSSVNLVNTNWYIVIVSYDGSGNWIYFVNGTTDSGTNNQTFTGGGNTLLSNNNFWDGYIGEVLKFSSVVSVATIDTYLNGRWAVH